MTVIADKSGFAPKIYFQERSERSSLFLLSWFFDIPDEKFIYTFWECSCILDISFKSSNVFDRVYIMLSISEITIHGSSYQYGSVWGKVFLYLACFFGWPWHTYFEKIVIFSLINEELFSLFTAFLQIFKSAGNISHIPCFTWSMNPKYVSFCVQFVHFFILP